MPETQTTVDRFQKDDGVIGGGLLRLLADTVVLSFKTRHVCWRARDVLGDQERHLLCEEQGMLCSIADEIADEITRLGVSIPGDFAVLAAMSSIQATLGSPPVGEVIRAVADDHHTILADIETLRVTLPLEDSPKVVCLLDRLVEHYGPCADTLARILPN